jgi:hypothetical protein
MRLALLLAVAAALAVTAGTARADGDPASDVLAFQDVYLPFQAPSQAAKGRLADAIAASNRAGRPIKVAVIATAQDLGSIPSLFGKPAQYAHFLGLELPFYPSRLLIVMPAGFGVWEHGRSIAPAERALQGLAAGSDSESLTDAATTAVQRLRAVPEPVPDLKAPHVKALASKGVAGRQAALRYRVTDNSGRARAIVRVFGPGYQLYAALHIGYRAAKGAVQTAAWRVPARYADRTLSFCVVPYDRAANAGVPGCASLRIR